MSELTLTFTHYVSCTTIQVCVFRDESANFQVQGVLVINSCECELNFNDFSSVDANISINVCSPLQPLPQSLQDPAYTLITDCEVGGSTRVFQGLSCVKKPSPYYRSQPETCANTEHAGQKSIRNLA